MTRKARQLYGVSVMSFSFSAPRCHPALHRLCQSANDAWTRLSTCSLSSSGCYHRLSARLLIASSYLLFLITFTLADAHPLPQFPPLSTHFYSLNGPHPFAGATCGEQVNKSLSSSGEDNEATGVVFACCRCVQMPRLGPHWGGRRRFRYIGGIYIPPTRQHKQSNQIPQIGTALRCDVLLGRIRLSNIWGDIEGYGERGFIETCPCSTFSFMLSEFTKWDAERHLKYARGANSLALDFTCSKYRDNRWQKRAQLHFLKRKLWH